MMPQSAATSAGSTRHLFVYGTLRRGGRNDIARFLPAPAYVADASVAGTLYDFGSYPGVVLGGAGSVVGEIYAITSALEAQLDQLEEVGADDSGEYIKREVKVQAGARELACLVYEIHPNRIAGRPVIASGDWLRHVRSIS
jgi:gamma-glutamylcyclotransferase (GGCT)/AIG2-like uncharacterized protein YtfP